MVKQKNNVAFFFDDLTEFFVMRPEIDILQRNNISVDIIVPFDSGYNGLAQHTLNKIKEFGYSPKNDVKKGKKYSIIFEPYHLAAGDRANFDYRIRYSYGLSTSNKLVRTSTPEHNLPYDAFLVFDKRGMDMWGIYGSVKQLPPFHMKHFHKLPSEASDKKTLLYAPTFGDVSSIDNLDNETIKSLKTKYYIITKKHHQIHFNQDEQSHAKKLEKIADKIFDSDTPIMELLAKSDIVLSDNSGAIFDAIYTKTPVAVFSQNLNKHCLDSINNIQFDLAKDGILPWAKSPEQIIDKLDEAFKKSKEQLHFRDSEFRDYNKNSEKDFLLFINDFLKRDADKDLKHLNKVILHREWKKMNDNILSLNAAIRSEQNINQELREQINTIFQSNSWKITKPLRFIKTKIGKEKNNWQH